MIEILYILDSRYLLVWDEFRRKNIKHGFVWTPWTSIFIIIGLMNFFINSGYKLDANITVAVGVHMTHVWPISSKQFSHKLFLKRVGLSGSHHLVFCPSTSPIFLQYFKDDRWYILHTYVFLSISIYYIYSYTYEYAYTCIWYAWES